MSADRIEGVRWYTDLQAQSRGEPGIRHSYLTSLATVLNHLHPTFDPVWLMGASAFAFRIWVNERFCPSAMSAFDWQVLLPEAVEQAGVTCRHISRLWHEAPLEKERLREAEDAIRASLGDGVPVVAWDISDAEWGVITGCDDEHKSYSALTHDGVASNLPYDRLGRNGIDVLSVIVPGTGNDRTREESIARSLRAALEHAEQGETLERPAYQDGLPAYDLWAGLCNRWAMLIDAGRGDQVGSEIGSRAAYLAEHIFSARCYARDYLRTLAADDDDLSHAAECYADVARLLNAIDQFFGLGRRMDDATALRDVASAIRAVRTVEKHGLMEIRRWLGVPLAV